jgi:hypothetical protein
MDEISTKALYNALRLSEPDASLASWKTQNLRVVPLEKLFSTLTSLGLHLDKDSFLAYAEECDSPEDLLALLISDSIDRLSQEDIDHIFLLLFELFRRLIPEKKPLSIVADEIDQHIFLYDDGDDTVSEELLSLLHEYLRILQQGVDEGLTPSQAFKTSEASFAHDIARFLFDFIEERMDVEGEKWATSLLDDFQPFMPQKEWFECLRIQLSKQQNREKALEQAAAFFEKMNLKKDEGRSLALAIINFFAKEREKKLFLSCALRLLDVIEASEELSDLVEIMCSFLEELGDEELSSLILQEVRKGKSLDDVKKRFIELIQKSKAFSECFQKE